MKKIIFGIMSALIVSAAVYAEGAYGGTEIDLDSIRYNKTNNTSEIRMKIYNEDYNPGVNDLYYALYYLKMDCLQKTFKPMIIEGYNRRNELMLVDYDKRNFSSITAGSNIEQAYNYACQKLTTPDVKEKKSKKNKKK
ncbi:MAG: hypothetical protein K6C94_06005 [Candidatus Gastranaerophilales bacterium]|nr:hypothetical protein [Candidatus Gastranaerophilales bacterium]